MKPNRVVKQLTKDLHARMHAYSSEFRWPAKGPDESEAFLNEKKEAILKIRAMREEFERIITGSPL